MPIVYDVFGTPYLEPPYTPEELATIERVAFATPRLMISAARRGDSPVPDQPMSQPQPEGG